MLQKAHMETKDQELANVAVDLALFYEKLDRLNSEILGV